MRSLSPLFGQSARVLPTMVCATSTCYTGMIQVMEKLLEQKCKACRAGAPPVTPEEIRTLQPQVPEWRIIIEEAIPKLDRVFRFRDFKDAIAFTDAVGAAAEEQGHHPRLVTEWGRVAVTWWTHKIRNLHKNDFIMAARTDAVYEAGIAGKLWHALV